MIADATTTPSEATEAAAAVSAVEMPKPMTTGRSVTCLRRPASSADHTLTSARSPVTPSTLTP